MWLGDDRIAAEDFYFGEPDIISVAVGADALDPDIAGIGYAGEGEGLTGEAVHSRAYREVKVVDDREVGSVGGGQHVNPHFPDELPDFGMQFAPTL